MKYSKGNNKAIARGAKQSNTKRILGASEAFWAGVPIPILTAGYKSPGRIKIIKHE